MRRRPFRAGRRVAYDRRMPTHQFLGIVLIVAGVLDAAAAMWIPSRIPDERQRAIVRVALLSSGVIVVALGGLFFSGVLTKS